MKFERLSGHRRSPGASSADRGRAFRSSASPFFSNARACAKTAGHHLGASAHPVHRGPCTLLDSVQGCTEGVVLCWKLESHGTLDPPQPTVMGILSPMHRCRVAGCDPWHRKRATSGCKSYIDRALACCKRGSTGHCPATTRPLIRTRPATCGRHGSRPGFQAPPHGRGTGR